MSSLEPLVGEWEQTAAIDGRTMSVARTRFAWVGGLLLQHTAPPSFLVDEWVGAAPENANMAFGADDYTGELTMLYADARGVSRRMAVTFDGTRWTMQGRPGETFFQRFWADVETDEITGAWERSEDGESWEKDFDVTLRRV
jgi:hypothetical protein